MSSNGPIFPLREVVDLAKQGKVTFTRTTQIDLVEMGLSLAGGKEIIAWLTEDEFEERWYGDATKQWWDVYLAPRVLPNRPKQPLYVKLRIPKEPVVRQVLVTSCHVQRLIP